MEKLNLYLVKESRNNALDDWQHKIYVVAPNYASVEVANPKAVEISLIQKDIKILKLN